MRFAEADAKPELNSDKHYQNWIMKLPSPLYPSTLFLYPYYSKYNLEFSEKQYSERTMVLNALVKK